jgi:hypothetical protein
MATLAAVNETLQANNDNVVTGDTMIVQAVDRLNSTMSGMVKMMQLQNLKLLEALREKAPGQAAPDAPAGPAAPDSNIGKILAGIAAFTIGFLSGLADSFRKIFALTKFDKVLTGIGKTIDAFTDFVKSRFTRLLAVTKEGPLAKLVAGVRTNFTEIFDFLKNSVFGKIVTAIKNILVFPFEGLFVAEGAANVLTRIKNAIIGPFQAVFNAVKGIFTFAVEGSGIMKVLGTLGSVLGKLFFPFTVIMSIYDTVKGAIAGFEEGGILGGLAGAITGLLNSIVGMPLDLLRKAVSFILGKLGFEQASEALDSFSFQDIIKKVIFSFVGFLRGVVNGLIEGVATLVESVPFGDEVADKIRGLKFKEPEGGPSTESDAPVDMEAPEQQAVSGGFMDESFTPEPPVAQPAEEADKSAGRRKYERIIAKRDRRAEQMQRQQQGQAPIVVNAPTIDNSSTSSSSNAMVMPMAAPHDAADPLLVN